MQRTTVKLPDERDVRLRHEARRHGRTVSELTRGAIENLLGVEGGRRRLLAASAGASGRGDVSERIEEILADEVQRSHSSSTLARYSPTSTETIATTPPET